MIKRRLVMMLVVVAMMMGAMAPASASEAACSGFSGPIPVIVNHGEHITRNYVIGTGSAGGGLPAHFGDNPGDPTPGATFCNTHGSNMAPDLPARP